MKPEKPFNGGQWTRARMKSFVMSALRGASWPQKYEAIRRAFVKNGINIKTGRNCKLHRCAECEGLFPKNGVQADHIVPVIGPNGFDSWDLVVERLFCEASGFRILCKKCHKAVTKLENEERRNLKLSKKQ